jgi:uncharacterized damage-inducible protein DinB
LDHAAQVSTAQLVAPADVGSRNLRETLFHMMATEWTWRVLAQEGEIQPDRAPRSADLLTLEQIRAFWRKEEQRMRTYLDGLSGAELAQSVTVKRRDGRHAALVLWHMLMHANLHSAQHRSEAAAMLTGYGQSPGDLDFVFFLADAS